MDFTAPRYRLRRALARHRADRGHLRGAAGRAVPAATLGGPREDDRRARDHRRALHLAVGREQGPGRGRAATGRAGAGGGADRDPGRRGGPGAGDARARRRGRRAGRVRGAAAGLGAGDGDPEPGPEPGQLLHRARAALDPALRDVRVGDPQGALAGVGPEVPGDRLGRLGDAALRLRDALRRLRLDRLQRDRRVARLRRPGRRLADPDRDRDGRRRARLQALAGPLPPVDARRLPGRPDPGHGLHGGGDQGRGLHRAGAPVRGRARPAVRRLAAGAGGAGRDLDRGRQRRRARPGLAQAPARLLGDRPGGLHARRGRGREPDRARGAGLLPRRLLPDEPGGLRGDHDPRARDRTRATTSAR